MLPKVTDGLGLTRYGLSALARLQACIISLVGFEPLYAGFVLNCARMGSRYDFNVNMQTYHIQRVQV